MQQANGFSGNEYIGKGTTGHHFAKSGGDISEYRKEVE